MEIAVRRHARRTLGRTALGPQTAIVVGLADAISTTTRDHQVRMQFAWQRGEGAN
jgi:type VI secretion system secreted protein VgrG